MRRSLSNMRCSASTVSYTHLDVYKRQGYVSVEVYGQTVTLAVPESAQAYLPYLAYVQ